MISKPQYSMGEFRDFIQKDRKKHGSTKDDAIVFFGGEPLLNQEGIVDCIRKTKSMNLKYILQTNGTLLNKCDPYILENLDYIFVSVDGTKEIHDKFRVFPDGRGTYDLIMNNVDKIKGKYNAQMLARMTITPQTPFYDAVMSVIDRFDHVHYQIMNRPSTSTRAHKFAQTQAKGEWENFKTNYGRDLDKLINYWTNEMKDGKIRNIVPFQAIIDGWLSERKHEYIRCGCLSSLVVIYLDGKCYSCDEHTGEKEFYIGNIKDGVSFCDKYEVSENIRNYCTPCDVVDTCAGRCLSMSVESAEIFRDYCDTTKILLKKLNNVLFEIKEFIDKGIISPENFKNPVAPHTEEIP